MKKLVLATHNKGKVSELSELLAPLGIEVASAAEFNIPEPEETGETFHENAKLKAVHSAKISGLPALADDSGLCIPALGGAPGIYSARWAGPGKDFNIAFERIKKELSNLPPIRGDERGVGAQHRPFNSDNLAKAKELRKNSTSTEQLLWSKIRAKQLRYKFRRQEPLENYIADFICLERKLIIELDGGQHLEQQNYDNSRTAFFEESGYRVVRFWNHEVKENLEGVLEKISETLDTPPPAPPNRRGVSGIEAYFICVLSLALPDGSSVEFEGRIDGKLTFPPRGANGFGYDPIFTPNHDSRTFGEMSQLEKNQKNHRAEAFDKFKNYLLKDAA